MNNFVHPNDGFYQIEAAGEHPNRNAGVIQVIDSAARESIVSRFNKDAAAGQLRNGKEMLIDHEHFKHDPDKETIAYGWLTELQNRDDGVYGKIRWTRTGKAAVDGGDYRFFSTEYDSSDLKVLDAGKPRRVRPLRLDGLTLTNLNNNLGQRPITNRFLNPSEVMSKTTAGNLFLNKAAALKAERRLGWNEALATARKEFRSLWEAIPDEDDTKALLLNGIRKNQQKAALRLNDAALKIVNRDKCTWFAAWNKARHENPELFAEASDL